MVKKVFQKIFNQPDVYSILENLSITLQESFQIIDINNSLVFPGVEQEFCDTHPIYVGNVLLGWVLGSAKVAVVAQILSYIASVELQKKDLANETLAKYEEVNFIYEVSGKIATSETISEITLVVIEEIKKILKVNDVTVVMLNENTGELEAMSLDSEGLTLISTIEPSIGITANVLNSGQAEIINNVTYDLRYVGEKNTVHSLICAPLTIHNKTIGVIKIYSQENEEFTSEQLKLFASLSSQTAAALQTSYYYEKLKNYFQTLDLKTSQKLDEKTSVGDLNPLHSDIIC